MDLHMFAEAVHLTPNEAIAEVQELAKEGFLHKVGAGYGLTEKGKNALKTPIVVSSEKAFQFYIGVDRPLGFNANSLEEFYRLIKQVCSDSLDFHLYRGDFENWLSQVIGDKELADEVAGFKASKIYGEELRKLLLRAIDARYGVGELL
jgi:hypothetical protein